MMPFTIGETIGPYQLIEQLGQGGMATVFKAYHPALDRYVAIKALHPAFTLEPNFLARFQREAQVVAKLEHPNIVPVYDYSEHEGRPFLVLKFIEGRTLKARLIDGRLDIQEINIIVESVGAALEYAHTQGVLHRDVKPSNVLLAVDERIYLADFGLARIAQAGESTISSDVMLGTPQYISPEQAMGQRELDGGTDIYSFGVLLYELIVGRVPYSADTPYSIIHDHIYAPLPLPRTINEDVPEPIERLLLKALAKDRKDRFESVADMLTAWHVALADVDRTIAALPVGMGELVSSQEPEAISSKHLSVESSESFIVDSDVINEAESSELESDLPFHGTEGKPKSRHIWPGLAGVVLLFCLCVGGALFILPRIRGQSRRAGISATISPQTQMAGEVGVTPLSAEIVPSPGTVKPTNQNIPLIETISIDDAQQRVAADPNKPYANLSLAIAYWDAGNFLEAKQAFDVALEHTENDTEFYMRAGDILMQRQLWLEAAKLYLGASRLENDPVPPGLLDRTLEALYLAASDPKATDLMGELSGSRVSLDFIAIIQARHALSQGQLARAKASVRRLNDKNVELAELKLLEAEIALVEGDNNLAIDKLEGLLEDPTTSRWVRQVAEYILNESKSGE